VAPQVAASARQDISYGVVDVELGQLRSGLLGERPQASDYVTCARAVPHDARECIPRLIEIRLLLLTIYVSEKLNSCYCVTARPSTIFPGARAARAHRRAKKFGEYNLPFGSIATY
jgi:hypothetical protein